MKNKHFFIIGGGDLQADLVLHAKKILSLMFLTTMKIVFAKI
ncbi:hypothetical protein OLQ14_05365 [Campylobacter jejuni]|nr:hypothetical protein [Campylobacter jejuni]MCW1864131.1 hypothetical protein [Campylobacter jejuni]